MAPEYLSVNFQPVSATHAHDTRGSRNNYSISKELARNQSSFALSAIKEWNGLPDNLKEIVSLPIFRAKVKGYLASRYWFYSGALHAVLLS